MVLLMCNAGFFLLRMGAYSGNGCSGNILEEEPMIPKDLGLAL